MNTPATYLQKCDKANPEEHTKEYLMYNYGIEASKFEARLVESLDEIKSFHHTTLKTLLGMIEEMVDGEQRRHYYPQTMEMTTTVVRG